MNKCFNLPSFPDVEIINCIILSEPKAQESVAAGYIELTLFELQGERSSGLLVPCVSVGTFTCTA